MYRLLIGLGYVFPIITLIILVFGYWYCFDNTCWGNH